MCAHSKIWFVTTNIYPFYLPRVKGRKGRGQTWDFMAFVKPQYLSCFAVIKHHYQGNLLRKHLIGPTVLEGQSPRWSKVMLAGRAESSLLEPQARFKERVHWACQEALRALNKTTLSDIVSQQDHPPSLPIWGSSIQVSKAHEGTSHQTTTPCHSKSKK